MTGEVEDVDHFLIGCTERWGWNTLLDELEGVEGTENDWKSLGGTEGRWHCCWEKGFREWVMVEVGRYYVLANEVLAAEEESKYGLPSHITIIGSTLFLTGYFY